MSACADRQLALSAYLDAELDAAATRELELHLARCPDCRADLAAIDAVSEAVRHAGIETGAPVTGPAAGILAGAAARPLADATFGASVGAPHPRRFSAGARALAAAAVLVLAVAAGYGIGRSGRDAAAASDAVTADLLSAHLRALLPGRLVDVASSDRHQVKPWFAGHLDFAPPVPDLAARGFPLLGGRLDFVAGQRAAVLVYGRHLHRIDVFVLPAERAAALRPAPARLGYHFVSWREGPLSLIAVSDVDPSDLRLLAALHAAAP